MGRCSVNGAVPNCRLGAALESDDNTHWLACSKHLTSILRNFLRWGRTKAFVTALKVYGREISRIPLQRFCVNIVCVSATYIRPAAALSSLGKQGDGQGVYIYGTPVKSACEKSNRSFYCRNGSQIERQIVFVFTGLVFNWSAAKLFSIMDAIIMRPGLCLPILLCILSIIMLSVPAYAWSAPQRSSAGGKIYLPSAPEYKSCCYLWCFHRGMQFFMLPRNFMSHAIRFICMFSLSGLKIFISRVAERRGKFFHQSKMSREIC